MCASEESQKRSVCLDFSAAGGKSALLLLRGGANSSIPQHLAGAQFLSGGGVVGWGGGG